MAGCWLKKNWKNELLLLAFLAVSELEQLIEVVTSVCQSVRRGLYIACHEIDVSFSFEMCVCETQEHVELYLCCTLTVINFFSVDQISWSVSDSILTTRCQGSQGLGLILSVCLCVCLC